jgi:SAM-dependent methyltransferase
MSADTAVETCQACGSASLRPRFSVAGGMGEEGLIPTTDRYGTALADVSECTACGHMQLQPMPTEAVLENAYAEAASDDYLEEELGQRETARRILTRIERHRGPGDLVDLGCWLGFLPDEARKRGWRPVGIEPSAFASEFARSRLGLDVRTEGLFDADLPSESFDAAVLGDVIEHLPRPGDALDRIAGLLRPGGVLTMMLPDAGSRVARTLGRRWWSIIPTHVHHFTRASMRRLLEGHGWEVLEIDTAPKAFTVRYYLERIGGYSPPVSRALVRGAEAARVADRMWAPDFRDRMLVIARRPAAG